MKRGVIQLTTESYLDLTSAINWEIIPVHLSERLKAPLGQQSLPTVSLFLSEEEVESILDSLSPDLIKENPRIRDASNTLHAFLLRLRRK